MPEHVERFFQGLLEWICITHSLCANEFVTNIKWEEQLKTVVNIYCKTSSPPNFLSDSESTDVAKVNDFRQVVVNVKSQKPVMYIVRATFSWPRTSDSLSNILDCSKQTVTAVSQEWFKNIPWDQKVMNVHT